MARPLSKHAHKCKSKSGKCRYCTNLSTSGQITSKFTSKTYKCKTNVTCKSSNLIYCIQCKTCGLQYVEQTKNILMQKFQGHLADINMSAPKSNVGAHFNNSDHNGGQDMGLFALDFIHAEPNSDFASALCYKIEFHWVQHLGTMLPHSIKTMDCMPVL